MTNIIKTRSNIGIMRDDVVRKIFNGESDTSCELIEETTNHRYKKKDILKSMVMLSNNIAYNINTIDSETDTILKTNDLYVNIEYNTRHYKELDIKNNAYICNLVLKQIKTKKDYKKVKPVIQINIDNYDLYGRGKFLYESVLMDKDIRKERPNNFIEIYDINLEKIKKRDYNKREEREYNRLKEILYFLTSNNKEELEELYKEDKLMEKVMSEVLDINDEIDRLFFYNPKELERQRDERLQEEAREKGLKQGLKQGIKQGIKQWIEQGIAEGREESIIEMIKNMLEKKMIYADIADITGKDIETIKKIKNSMN